MQAIIRYPNDDRSEVLVLAIGRYTMRVLPRYSVDTLELTSSFGRWTDESGVPVEFESFVVDENDIGKVLEGRCCTAAS